MNPSVSSSHSPTSLCVSRSNSSVTVCDDSSCTCGATNDVIHNVNSQNDYSLDYVNLPSYNNSDYRSRSSSINSNPSVGGYYPRTYPQDLSSMARSYPSADGHVEKNMNNWTTDNMSDNCNYYNNSFSDKRRKKNGFSYSYSYDDNYHHRQHVEDDNYDDDDFDEQKQDDVDNKHKSHNKKRSCYSSPSYHDPTCTTLNCQRPSCLVPDYLVGDCESFSCTCCDEQQSNWQLSGKNTQTSYTQPKTTNYRSLYQLQSPYQVAEVHNDLKKTTRKGCSPFPPTDENEPPHHEVSPSSTPLDSGSDWREERHRSKDVLQMSSR